MESENNKTQTLIAQVQCHQHELIRFVDHPEAEFHNNRVERALRPAVIFRKISFGHRTPAGAYHYAILASVLETGRLKNINLTDFIYLVWLTPKEHLHRIAKALLDAY